jgi:ATP-dependent helicase HepA
MVASGDFVRSRANGMGLGKVIAAYGDLATVEYFFSVTRHARHELPQEDLEVVHPLPAHTACYYWDDDRNWRLARVRRWADGCYQITLSDGRYASVTSRDLYVTAAVEGHQAPHDPLDALLLRWLSNAGFHDSRHAFVKHTLEMISATLGMTGLSSARLSLIPHQVEIIRRILEDPVQRYLLADEVGLGKTIEAGVVLRQFLLDAPETRALLIAPPFLLSQWRRELLVKFTLGDFVLDRVRRIGWNQVDQIRRNESYGLIILDEAHNVAAWANSDEPALRHRYEHVADLAHKAPRLLLLSATPVLNREQDFLAMLHLLDPSIYKLDDLKQFKERVQNRQAVGRLLLMLREGASPFIAKLQMGQLHSLRSAFAQDEVLAERIERLQSTLESTGTSQSELDEAIRLLRIHIGETYRLHRRLLRTHRRNVDAEILPRRCEMAVESDPLSTVGVADDDPRMAALGDLLESWRDAAVNESMRRAAAGDEATKEHLAQVFGVLIQASWSCCKFFCELVKSRVDRRPSHIVADEVGQALANTISRPPSFEGEGKLLRDMLAVALEDFEHDRSARLGRFVESECERLSGGKFVIFTSYRSVCRRLTESLAMHLGEEAVVSHESSQGAEEIEEAVERFEKSQQCKVLICDPSGEEGRNLQFVDWLVHYDIPLMPNRIEQRIGRVDRIGRSETLRSLVFHGIPGSMQLAWCRMLSRGFGVFAKSIAGLQFYVDRKMPRLEQVLFIEGAAGLEARIEEVAAEVVAELRMNAEQYALDEMDTIGRSGQEFIRRMDQFESDPTAIADAVEKWACDTLRFQREDFVAEPKVVRYNVGLATSIPHGQLPFWKRLVGARGTYVREVATQAKTVRLFRPGEPFIDALMHYAQENEQGRAFAVWRVEPSWDRNDGSEWTGFRFNFIVEANLDRASWVFEWGGMAEADRAAFARQAVGFFPPMMRTVYVDSDGQAVTDERLLVVLRRPFLSADKGGTDFSLEGVHGQVLDALIDPAQWKHICSAAAEKAKEVLRHNEAFASACASRRQQAERDLLFRAERMRLRMTTERQIAKGLTITSRDMEIEDKLRQVLLDGIVNPHLRLDSIGLLIIAGRAPVARDC